MLIKILVLQASVNWKGKKIIKFQVNSHILSYLWHLNNISLANFFFLIITGVISILTFLKLIGNDLI